MRKKLDRSDSKTKRGALMKKNSEGWLKLLRKKKRKDKLLKKKKRKRNSKCKSLKKLGSYVSKRKRNFVK